MENKIIPIEEVLIKVENYSKTSYHLAKLKSLKATTSVASTLILNLCIAIPVMMGLGILAIAIGLWLGELLGKYYYGFFIMAIVFLLIAFMVAFFLSKKIKTSISNFLIKYLLHDRDH